jgi:lipoate-protein ligase A
MAPALEIVVQSGVSPRASVAEDRAALARAAETGRGTLRVYECAGAVLSLGRYHLRPEGDGSGVALLRRHSGGRAVPFGEGFLGVTLALPHRAAFIAAEPLTLAPAQVMNRWVRGILAGLEHAGVPAFYPGRDLVTAGGRVLGMVSFEVDERGACLFEAVLANGRDLGILPALLDAADPDGVVTAEMPAPDAATSVAREAGRPLPVAEAAQLLAAGYHEALGLETSPGAPAADAGAAAAFDEAGWLGARRRTAHLDRRATTRTQLGVLECHLAVADGRIDALLLSGDLIANSPAVAAVEGELRGVPAEREAAAAVVERVFGRPENFVLGVGPVGTVSETIAAGLPR